MFQSKPNKNTSRFAKAITVLGFIFLYLPLVLLVIYSFNSSRLVTVWQSFSTEWYRALLTDDQILGAFWISLKVAFFSATLATITGSLAAYAVVSIGAFFGRKLLSGMLSALLVIPEVILGLSMLLLFVAMESFLGWPGGRGMMTIIIAHATMGSAFVAIVVQASLASEDRNLELAAQDLGATPLVSLLLITVPLHAPALLSGWLLAFTLSLDDLVIASFVSGPASSTLPMVVFSKVRLGVSPAINALASLMLLAVTCGVILAGFIMHRRFKHYRSQI